ncbi:hypothetical protein PHLCEN_2v13295 [Hermanssonia centrifuga]|uniref:Alpha/beta-hydrolase n=1 Tax=Hermanssonia centrifuga TaxID=98765 RepID=A0A2R6NEP7_9APHY|nr:hypothetical protein PHLCEN_2v13295 [Hermanssonia centrifuga]
MPTIPVNSDGAVLYYEDSGAPDGPDPYCTIVLIHGLIFNGDPPNFVFGTPLPEEIYVPFRDASIAFSELARRFTIWVSTYHGPVSDITTITAQAIGSRENPTHGTRVDAGYFSVCPFRLFAFGV